MNKGYAMGFISSEIKNETISLKNGDHMAKARFSVACQRRKKEDGADFLFFTVFGGMAETISRYFEKGKGIFLEYHVQNNSYTGKDGSKVFKTDFIVDGFEFVPVRKIDEQQASNAGGASFGEMINTQPETSNSSPSQDGFINVPDNIVDDLPFR